MMHYYEHSDKVYKIKNGKRVPVHHAYVVNPIVEGDVLIGGKFLSGITTVINETSSKMGLVQWAADEAIKYITAYLTDHIQEGLTIGLTNALEEARNANKRKKDDAATKGTDLHAIAELYIKECIAHNNGEAREHVEISPIKVFTEWAVANKVRFIAAEKRMWNEEYGIAGTCDFIAEVNGKTVIGDIKTFPKMHSADAFIQMGGYALMYPEKIDGTIIVKICDPTDWRLEKYNTKPFAVYERNAIDEDKDMFLTRLKMYRYNENFVSPKE